MIADIASGNTGTADVFFLIAVILCILVVIGYLYGEPIHRLIPALGWAAVGCIAFGFLML